MKKFSRTLAVMLTAVAMILPGTVQAVSVGEEPVERYVGKDRVETSIKVSDIAYTTADAVVVAGWNGEADALTGTLLASAKKAPLLLVSNKDEDIAAVRTKIESLGAQTVYLLGDTNVVSQKAEDVLGKGLTVKRIAGGDRFDTAVEVAKEVKSTTGHAFITVDGRSGELADALAAGPASGLNNSPILLTSKNSVPAQTKQALKDLNISSVTIVGGTSAVSSAVETAIKAEVSAVNRLEGKERVATAAAVAKEYFADSDQAIIANDGRVSYADALVGGYLGAMNKAPILLTQENALPDVTRDYLEVHATKAFVLGGKKVVVDSVFENAKKAVIDELTASKATTLSKDYKSVKVTGNDIVIDLAGKTVRKMLVTSNDAVIKNGTVNNITIGKDVTNVTLEDIVDDGTGNHDFQGGGSESIILRGKTQLKSPVNITSATPIQIRAEELAAGKGMTGTVSVNTEAAVIIAAPVEELEIKKENKDIQIKAEVKKVSALANVKVTIAKDVKMPKLEKAKGVTATATDSTGKEEEFEENEELKPSKPEDEEAEKPEDEDTNIGGGGSAGDDEAPETPAAIIAVNNATTSAEMAAALEGTELGLNLAVYNSLIKGRQLAVAVDMLANKPTAGFADKEAVETMFNKLVSVRSSIQTVMDAAASTDENKNLKASDFEPNGRMTAVGISLKAAGKLEISGQEAAFVSAGLENELNKFNGLKDDQKAPILEAINKEFESFSQLLFTAGLAYDKL